MAVIGRESSRRRGQEKEFAQLTETGQSIVIVALVFIGLLAFTALAVDAGLAFVRSSQFSAAVDAAALAGVVDLDPASDITTKADERAWQFLSANGWPTPTLSGWDSSRSYTKNGIPQYSITATWPVEFNFARLIGLSQLEITHPATAAYFAQAEIFVPTANDNGRIRIASQYVVGAEGCTNIGDPVQPLRSSSNPDMPNVNYTDFNGLYRYRIRIHEAYSPTNIVRVELFDPDSRNLNLGDTFTITHSQSYSDLHGVASTPNVTCDNTLGDGDSCVMDSGERYNAAFENPLWYVRVDENWDQDCNHATSDPLGEAVTTYNLYYFDDDGNKVPLSSYTVDNNASWATDMKWVTPGVTPGVDVVTDAITGTFDVDISPLPISQIRGFRFIYLDVTTSGGSAKNVWDIRAGPPPIAYTTPDIPELEQEVNLRNLQIANWPSAYTTRGLFVEALGHLPTQYHVDGRNVTTQLTPIDISLGVSTIYVRHFDYDISAPPPVITFTIDTAQSLFNNRAVIVDADPDPTLFQASCVNGSNCDNSWSYPQYAFGIPGSPFAGGVLEVNFIPYQKEMVWSTSVTAGRPFLTD